MNHPDSTNSNWPERLTGDLGAAFSRLTNRLSIRYRGYLAEHSGDWILWDNRRFPSKDKFFDAVDEAIEESRNAILKSFSH